MFGIFWPRIPSIYTSLKHFFYKEDRLKKGMDNMGGLSSNLLV